MSEIDQMEGESVIDHYERVADMFYRETGMMRPGKDVSAHDGSQPPMEVRSEAFREWRRNRIIQDNESTTATGDGGVST